MQLVCIDGRNGSLEVIAYPRFCYDISGVGEVGLYFLAQMPDIDTHIVQVISIFPPPHLFQQLAVGENAAGVLQQECQQAKLGGGQLYLLAVDNNPPFSDIYGEKAIAIDSLLGGARWRG